MKHLIFVQRRIVIYTFFDIPHLMKTTRNSPAKSGEGRGTGYMWYNGNFILMNPIATLCYENYQSGSKLLPKLRDAHFRLTAYSVMSTLLYKFSVRPLKIF